MPQNNPTPKELQPLVAATLAAALIRNQQNVSPPMGPEVAVVATYRAVLNILALGE